MGQDFLFLNIDKRQKFGGSKFGETFPHSGYRTSQGTLIELLAVPEAGYDDSQDRKRRSWLFPEGEEPEPISWAGNRIICVGGYVNDWPDSVLASEDCKSLESPKFLYDNAPALPRSYRDYPAGVKYSGTGVLRNLTKKLYVRSEGIPTHDRNGRLQYFEDSSVTASPGLAHILMGRIGWSQDPSVAMSWDEADTLAQGEWAGDRFDVRSWKDVKAELESDDDWTDVTEREAERFIRVWEADGF